MLTHEITRTDRLTELMARIKESGLRMTPQREAILRTLVLHPGHPSVEDIYTQLLPHFPNMSLATVYKTIAVLKDLGEVQEIEFSSRDNRFDGHNPRPHPHLICTRCGRIDDPDIPGLGEMVESLNKSSGFSISSYRMDFYGLCPDCLKK